MDKDQNELNGPVDLEKVQSSESSTPDAQTAATPESPDPTPTPDMVPLHQAPPLPIQEPKSSKGKIFAIILLVVLLLGAAGAAYYYFVASKPTSTVATASTSPTPSVSKTPTPSLTAATLVPDVKAALKSTPVTLTDKTGRWEAPDGTVAASMASYTLNGYDFITNTNKGVAVAVSSKTADKATTDTDYTQAINILMSKGLKVKGTPTDDTNGKSSVYASDEVVCSLDVMYALRGYNYLGIACGDMTDYVAAYKAAKPFYDVYVAAKPAEAGEVSTPVGQLPLTVGQPAISNGADGYKNASVNIARMTGSAGLFYQEPGKDWAYFTSAQQDLPCTQYNTAELKKAFSGVTCFDAAGNQSTVKA